MMRNHSTKGSTARRLVMSDMILDSKGLSKPQAVILRNSPESQKQNLLAFRLCSEDFSREKCDLEATNLSSRENCVMPKIQDSQIRPAELLCRTASSSSSTSVTSDSSRSSPNGLAYAGAKFNSSPSPKVLPRPPSHWMCSPKVVDCGAIESKLKVMLKVAC